MRGIAKLGALVFLCAVTRGGDPSDSLFQAIRNNDLAFLKAQAAKGTDLNIRGPHGMTPLIYAAGYGSADAVKLLLDAGADVNAKSAFSATALILGSNDLAKARLLIAKGADVNASSKLGRTPLMTAASCGDCSEIVRLLLDKGADLEARSAEGGAGGGHKDAEGSTALQAAADYNDLESMRLLIAKGADARRADKSGNTPLLSAASNCNLEAVNLLLSHGADVNAAVTFAGKVRFGNIALIGMTPLTGAAPYCGPDVIQALLLAGANVNAKDVRNMTPLMLAVASETQNTAVVKLLLRAGADVKVKSDMNETALDWARKFGNGNPETGNRDVIAALLAAGAPEGPHLTPPERPAAKPRTVRQAVEAGAALLQRSSMEFFKQSGCVSCHSQSFTSMATAAARRFGARVDEGLAREIVGMPGAQFAGLEERLLERMHIGGDTDPVVYALFAMSAEGYPADEITDTMATYVADAQWKDGTWRLTGISRSPIEESIIGRTAMALHALQVYGPPARKPEFETRIARAREWIEAAKPITTDDYAMKLLGLYWAGAGRDQIQQQARALLALAHKQKGGAWGQNLGMPSDAYATGEALWALHETGAIDPSDPVYQNGARFLLRTQWEDGSWYVRSRAVKFQPYFQSGFPFDHDQWISSAATAWAVMALAPAIEKEATASR